MSDERDRAFERERFVGRAIIAVASMLWLIGIAVAGFWGLL